MERKKPHSTSRRDFLYNLGLAGLSIPVFSATGECNQDENKSRPMNNKNANDFVVVLDQLKNNYYEATESYKVSSIPAKYIIDKNGRIRYKSTGFSSDENLIKGLKTVVKMISE